jgi:hypothetical protein
MTTYKVVVDGSNIATEGRTSPSLKQLDEAVRSFIEEHPGADVLVVVDTSFPNKIEASEHPIFEAAYQANEIITPPAGTIGRGDAFILKIADKMGATVFSNDSFQEFHGTYDWLFDKGRLVGGKPIPGLGWVFTQRTPVRGVKSREAVKEAKRTRARIGSPEASMPMPVPKAPPQFAVKLAAKSSAKDDTAGERGDRAKRRRGRRTRPDGADSPRAEAVPAQTPASVGDADNDRKRKKRRRKGKPAELRPVEPINEPLPFVTFVAEHPIGASVDGEVESYSSHGFYVTIGSARCYVPLSGVSVPQPRAAKDVVKRGETREFIVRAFDAPRRGIELALPGTPAASRLGSDGDAADGGDDDDEMMADVALAPRRGKKSAAAAGTPAAGSAKSGKPAKSDKSGKPAKPAKADKVPKAEKPAKADKAPKSEKPATAEKPAKPAKSTKSAGSAKGEKPEKPTRAEKSVKPTRAEKSVKPTKAEKSVKPTRAEKSVKPAKATSAEKPAKAAKPAKVAKAAAVATAKTATGAAKKAAASEKAPATKAAAAKSSKAPASTAAKKAAAKPAAASKSTAKKAAATKSAAKKTAR